MLAAVWLLLSTGCATRETATVESSVSVRVLDRDFVAIDAGTPDTRLLPLESGERVLSYGARGRVGIGVTNRRLVGYTVSGGWTERRLRFEEATPSRAEMGMDIALFLTSHRAIGFDGHWRESHFGALEEPLQSDVGAGSLVVVTNLRALALTSASGGFRGVEIREGEQVENVYALQTSAEVHTSERSLLFSGTWTELPR